MTPQRWSSTTRSRSLSYLVLLVLIPIKHAITVSSANPRYFEWKGRVVSLITSAEHYGGLVNTDFEYATYFKTLADNSFTLTQAFIGTYVEPDSDVNPTGLNPGGNTLSPANGSFIAPWSRVRGHPGGPVGGDKFNLTSFNEAYFRRLSKYVETASKYGVVVQLVLFCGYDANHQFIFDENPLNPNNNVNDFDPSIVNLTSIYSLHASAKVLSVELETVRRVVEAVKSYDNVIFELVFTTANVSLDFAQKLYETVHQANSASLIVVPEVWVSAMPASDVIVVNCGSSSNSSVMSALHPRVLDSVGVAGGTVADYRSAYWRWMLDGGGAIYNLDWSYTVGHEAGSKVDDQVNKTPSGAEYRRAVSTLAKLISTLDLVNLTPNIDWVRITDGVGVGVGVGGGDGVGVAGGVGSTSVSGLAPISNTPTTHTKPTTPTIPLQFAAYVGSMGVGETLSVNINTTVVTSAQCNIIWIDIVTNTNISHHLVVSPSWAPLHPPTSFTDVAFVINCKN